jgi:hypothetical protein
VGESQAVRAIEGLDNAIAVGYYNLRELRTDANLDALRPRPDFRLLLMDVGMPARPFDRPK